ncbi:MAG: methylmalonyl Co-A mutase-associated GTPase MeaB, partial [Pyrinomonadaceae bacterium]
VLVPGMGDDIQAIKAGIMEIGDVFVINKADREGVLRTQKELDALLSLAHRPDMWNPPIVKTIATESKGIEELSAAIQSYFEYQSANEHATERRTAIAKWRLTELLRERLLSDLLASVGARDKLDELAISVAGKTTDPYTAIEKILDNE